MADYRIQTKNFHGRVRSRIGKDGVLVKIETLPIKYQRVYANITKVHEAAITEGDLEKVTTIFSD